MDLESIYFLNSFIDKLVYCLVESSLLRLLITQLLMLCSLQAIELVVTSFLVSELFLVKLVASGKVILSA
jgi:hypothetical protein